MKLAKEIIQLLEAKNLTLAAAESETAGYLSYLLTKAPGSSKVFNGSLVVYSLGTKNNLFKIPQSILEKTQGVSKEIAAFLAEKSRKKLKSDIGISVVGFAGPAAKKGIKAGTAFIAISDKKEIFVSEIIAGGKRDKVRKDTAKFAADILRKRLKAL